MVLTLLPLSILILGTHFLNQILLIGTISFPYTVLNIKNQSYSLSYCSPPFSQISKVSIHINLVSGVYITLMFYLFMPLSDSCFLDLDFLWPAWTCLNLNSLGLAWTCLELAWTCLASLGLGRLPGHIWTCFGGDLLELASAGDKYQILGDVVDQGEALKSPTSLASLHRVSASCLTIIIDLDLFLGTVYREIGWCYYHPSFLTKEVAPFSTVAVSTDFTTFLL